VFALLCELKKEEERSKKEKKEKKEKMYLHFSKSPDIDRTFY